MRKICKCRHVVISFQSELFLYHCLVSGSVHKSVELRRIAHLNLNDPVLIWILVDKLRSILEGSIVLYNSSADWANGIIVKLWKFDTAAKQLRTYLI